MSVQTLCENRMSKCKNLFIQSLSETAINDKWSLSFDEEYIMFIYCRKISNKYQVKVKDV